MTSSQFLGEVLADFVADDLRDAHSTGILRSLRLHSCSEWSHLNTLLSLKLLSPTALLAATCPFRPGLGVFGCFLELGAPTHGFPNERWSIWNDFRVPGYQGTSIPATKVCVAYVSMAEVWVDSAIDWTFHGLNKVSHGYPSYPKLCVTPQVYYLYIYIIIYIYIQLYIYIYIQLYIYYIYILCIYIYI